jgi:cytochrome c-type biogenesis protein CcmH/NrfG
MRKDIIICLFLASLAFLLYGDLTDHQFIVVDDNAYIIDNSYVNSGLNRESVRWAFTTTRAEFWHPLTWLSYMLDTQLFGVDPGGYLFTNLLLHVLNSLLLFFIFKKMTGATWQSAFVAALFAIHPLHVESVAWIAERKDVLSALFWMLTIGFYMHYVKRPGPLRYLLVCILFVLGLMAKPMLVTLPFVLLLLDAWPLERIKYRTSPNALITSFFRLLAEKIPLLAISAAASAMTLVAQKRGGGLVSSDHYPIFDRIANAIVSYIEYIGKMIWPQNLAVFYPFPKDFSAMLMAGSLLALIFISVLAIRWARQYPFFIFGWLWYLGTLLPVIGLIKIGDFAMADRYTYIPLIGLFIIVAWGIPEICANFRFKKIILGAAAIIILVSFSVATWSQVRYWANSIVLFEQALRVTENNFFAHFALGHAYANQGRFDQSIANFKEAVRINPNIATLHTDLGRALATQGKFREAIQKLKDALEIKPDSPEAHYSMANVLVAQQKYDKAIYHFSEVIRLCPNLIAGQRTIIELNLMGYDKIISSLQGLGEIDQEIRLYLEILTKNPNDYDTLRKLAIAYSIKGNFDEALALLKVDKSTDAIIKAMKKGYKKWRFINYRIGGT